MFAILSFVIIILFKVIGLFRNVILARGTGLPYVLTPALETEILGHLLNPILRWKYRSYLSLGHGWPRWCRFIIREWAWEDGRRAHDEFGEVFLVVSPHGIICYSADSVFNHDVTSRRNEFIKPRDKYRLLEVFGPNVSTTEGKDFHRHLKITAPSFDESSGINSLVWNTTASRTKVLADAWASTPPTDCQSPVRQLALVVISKAGFGFEEPAVHTKHGTENERSSVTNRMTFEQAMNETIGFGAAATAHTELEAYFHQFISEERSKVLNEEKDDSPQTRGNLLNTLVRESMSRRRPDYSLKETRTLNEEELLGNMFIFLLGGHETTAHTMTYGLLLLALYPKIQDCVYSELKDNFHVDASTDNRDDYSAYHTILPRTHGFINETLRLFPIVIWITKMVQHNAVVPVSSKEGRTTWHTLPAGCRAYLNVPATQYSTRNWAEPKRLDINRWKQGNQSDRKTEASGRFLAFSKGARTCLGKKFALVELTSFFATLLKDYRVELGAGLDREQVERDLFTKCAERLTLAPPQYMTVRLEKR